MHIFTCLRHLGIERSPLSLRAGDLLIPRQLVAAAGPEVKGNATIATALLSYHLVSGAAAYSSSLKDGQKLTTGLSAKGSPVPPLTVRRWRAVACSPVWHPSMTIGMCSTLLH